MNTDKEYSSYQAKPARRRHPVSLARKAAMWIVGFIDVVVGVCTVCAGYAGTINPADTAIPAILALTLPLFIILLGTMLVISLLVSWKIALIPLVTVLICLGPIDKNMPLNLWRTKIDDSNRARSFRMLSYNVHQLSDVRYDVENAPGDVEKRPPVSVTLSYIINSGADILFLQEFPQDIRTFDRFRVQPSQVDSLETLYPYHASNAIESIYSKYPLTQVKTSFPDDRFAPYTAAIVDIEGHPTLAISTHMRSFELDSNDKALYRDITDDPNRGLLREARQMIIPKLKSAFIAQAEQAHEMRGFIDSVDVENVIVSGDFNNVPDSYPVRVVSSDDFHSAFADGGRGMMITYFKSRFYFHIDHTLYRGDMKAVDFHRGDCDSSDHYPIFTTFLWDEKQ